MRDTVIPESVKLLRQRIAERNQNRTGDKIHGWAAPIASGIDKVLGTNVAGCGGCNKMRERLNAGMSFGEATKVRMAEFVLQKLAAQRQKILAQVDQRLKSEGK